MKMKISNVQSIFETLDRDAIIELKNMIHVLLEDNTDADNVTVDQFTEYTPSQVVTALNLHLRKSLQVRDVITTIRSRPLHCGSGMYSCAVVLSVQPFILQSIESDMTWGSTKTVDDVDLVIGRVPEDHKFNMTEFVTSMLKPNQNPSESLS